MFFVSHSMFSVTHNMSKRKTVPVHQLLGFSHGLIFFWGGGWWNLSFGSFFLFWMVCLVKVGSFVPFVERFVLICLIV